MTRLTWLHISDLHFPAGGPYDRSVVLSAMIKHVRESPTRPDLIFATGDIAQSGKPAEYRQAAKFFDALLDASNLTKDRLFVIPGNHDVNIAKAENLKRTLDTETEADNFFDPQKVKLHIKDGQGAFLDWHNKYFKNIRTFSKTSTCGPVCHVTIKSMSVGILPINSALFCLGKKDEEGKIWIGRRCLDAALDNMQEANPDIRLVLIHHPLEWLHAFERRKIKDRLHGAVDAVLRGHLHATDANYIASAPGELLYLAAGASYTGEYAKGAMYATVEDDKLTLRPIRYEHGSECWTIDTGIGQPQQNHMLTFPFKRKQNAGVLAPHIHADLKISDPTYTTQLPGRATRFTKPIAGHAAGAPPPYPGLRAFREDEADYFFGREHFIEKLLLRVQTSSFVAIVGPSGSGKSSVLYAGLLPRLRKNNWNIATCRPGVEPLPTLIKSLIPLFEPGLSFGQQIEEAKRITAKLRDGEMTLLDYTSAYLERSQQTKLVILVDAFEELFVYSQDAAQRQFLDILIQTIHGHSGGESSRLTVLISMRADFEAKALSYRSLADALQEGEVKLGPLNAKELERVIEEPARRQSVQFDGSLTQRMIADVEAAPGTLPLLQFALERLWIKREGSFLTHGIYEELGKISGALTAYADEVILTMSEAQQRSAEKIFVQLIHPGQGTEDTRRRALRAELGDNIWDIVRHLADARLVVIDADSATAQETVEISHEALIKNWKKLQEWITTDRDFRFWQERLRRAVREWNDKERDEEFLFRSRQLAEAHIWIKTRAADLSPTENEFLSLSEQHHQKQKSDREAIAQLRAEKMQAIGQLAGGVAHDFNNLLTVIIGCCDLLLKRHPSGDASFADLINIKQNSNRAANLIRQLLAFSRRQTLQPKLLELTDVFAELSHLLRRLVGEHIDLKIVHGSGLKAVKADQGQLEQVIINLVVNARDAMPDGGTLTISTSRVNFGPNTLLRPTMLAPDEDTALPLCTYELLEVADTGVGIPNDMLRRIFEPFFSTKSVEHGTGLGLSTVYGIIKQMSGYVYVESTEGKGTKFSIFLKQYDLGEAVLPIRQNDNSMSDDTVLTNSGTLLVVEDEKPVRDFVARALRTEGYTVFEAENGEVGIAIMEKHGNEIDLIVCDVIMPKINGPTMIDKIRKTFPQMKVIFISGYAEEAFMNLLNTEEAFNFLPKPFTLKKLIASVKEVMKPTAVSIQSDGIFAPNS